MTFFCKFKAILVISIVTNITTQNTERHIRTNFLDHGNALSLQASEMSFII